MAGEKKTLFPAGKLVIYADGGARGNPGPAALGVVIGSRKYGERIGETTNNVAEYKALLFALQKAKQLLSKKQAKQTELEVRMDSELVVKQLNGKYKILEPDLQGFFLQIWNLKLDFKQVGFIHIPREENREADRLVNLALDGKMRERRIKNGGLLGAVMLLAMTGAPLSAVPPKTAVPELLEIRIAPPIVLSLPAFPRIARLPRGFRTIAVWRLPSPPPAASVNAPDAKTIPAPRETARTRSAPFAERAKISSLIANPFDIFTDLLTR